MSTYAQAEDIAMRLGRDLDDTESVIVETRLGDAEELLRLRIHDLDEKVTSGAIRERLIVMVQCEAVMRLIRNLDGMSQETDGNYSYQIDPRVASGRLSIEPDEWALLGKGSKVGVLRYNLDEATAHLHRPWLAQWWVPNPDDQDATDTANWG